MQEEFVPDPAQEREQSQDAADHSAALSILMLSLRTLSQKTLIAFSSLFTLLTAATVFALAYVISSSPSTYQLIELGLYSAFVLLLHITRKK